MVFSEPNSIDNDVLALRQQALEKLQQKILEKLQEFALAEVVQESGEELLRLYEDKSLALTSHITFTENGIGQINFTYSLVSSLTPCSTPPSPCPCTTGYFEIIDGQQHWCDCPCA